MFRAGLVLALAVISPLMIGGCNRRGDVTTVATGKGFEVTLPELEQVLRSAPPVGREEVVPARLALLNTLVNQKLLANAATDAGLERRPDVMQAIEAAKRELLAQAFVAQLANSSTNPSDSDIARYYSAHPSWFAARQRFDLEQIAIPAAAPAIKRYVAAFESGGLPSLTAALAQDGLPTDAQMISVGGDQLAGAEGQLSKLAAGSPVSYRNGPLVVFARVDKVVAEPLTLNQARPAIIARIQAEHRATLVKAEIERLRRDKEVHIDTAKLGQTPKSAQ